jgi:hypothetical protein
MRREELSANGGPSVAAESARAGACDNRQSTGRGKLQHLMAADVRDVESAFGVARKAVRRDQAGGYRTLLVHQLRRARGTEDAGPADQNHGDARDRAPSHRLII